MRGGSCIHDHVHRQPRAPRGSGLRSRTAKPSSSAPALPARARSSASASRSPRPSEPRAIAARIPASSSPLPASIPTTPPHFDPHRDAARHQRIRPARRRGHRRVRPRLTTTTTRRANFNAAPSPRSSRSRASSIARSSSTPAKPRTIPRAMVAEAGSGGRSWRAALLHRVAQPRRGGARVGWYVSFSAASSRSRSGTTTRCFASCPTIGCSSSRTRRISPRFRIAGSGTSRRGLASPSRALAAARRRRRGGAADVA